MPMPCAKTHCNGVINANSKRDSGNDNQEGRLHSLGRRVLEPRELLGTTELADLGNWYQSPGVGIIDKE